MAEHPDSRTSNYGWALWHLQEGSKGDGGTHPQHAIARALLYMADQLAAMRGVDPTGPTTWEGDGDD